MTMMNKRGYSLIEFMVYTILSVVIAGLCLKLFFSVHRAVHYQYYRCRCSYTAHTIYQRLAQDIYFSNPKKSTVTANALNLKDELATIVWKMKGSSLYRIYYDTHKQTKHAALIARDVKNFVCAQGVHKKIQIHLSFINNNKNYHWQVDNGWITL